eukprot:COSAG01_NODE_2570_length_7441_cov_2.829202_4_plen_355_part_00
MIFQPRWTERGLDEPRDGLDFPLGVDPARVRGCPGVAVRTHHAPPRRRQGLTTTRCRTLQLKQNKRRRHIPVQNTHGRVEALYNFNTMALHENFMKLIEENQGVGGDVPVVIPSGTPGNDIAWTAAYPMLTHDLYTYFGDVRVVERRWPSLVLYIENLIAKASSNPQDLAECDQFQDWLCGNGMSCCSKDGNATAAASCPVPQEMAGFNYVLGLQAMAAMAAALGKTNDNLRYAKLADQARQGFHAAFYEGKTGTYGNDFGAVQSLTLPALQIHSPPTSLLPHVVQTLQDDLATRTDYHLAVGAVTSKILLNVLSDNGLHSSAMRVATQTTEPSWGYWWSQNSTTCWETFPGGG